MLKTIWWIHVSYGFSYFECQKMRKLYARRWRKVEATGSTRHHITLWKKVGSDRTSWYIDGLIHSVFAGSPTLSQFDDSDTQIQTLSYCITEVYPVLIHWWVVYAILLLCWSPASFITLLSFTQRFHFPELYTILTRSLGWPYLITLLRNSQRLIHCWAIPNPHTLLRYSLS